MISFAIVVGKMIASGAVIEAVKGGAGLGIAIYTAAKTARAVQPRRRNRKG